MGIASDPIAAGEQAARRWSGVAWLVCSLVLVALMVSILLRVSSVSAGANLGNEIIRGDRPAAPALPTSELTDSGAVGLPKWYRTDGDHQATTTADAKVLVVNWWASWCGPCKAEAPVLQEIADDYKGRVDVVGINAGAQDLESDARAFVRQYKLKFTVVRGGRSDEDAWGIAGFPETFVVGTDGRISAAVKGPVDDDTLRAVLDGELNMDRG